MMRYLGAVILLLGISFPAYGVCPYLLEVLAANDLPPQHPLFETLTRPAMDIVKDHPLAQMLKNQVLQDGDIYSEEHFNLRGTVALKDNELGLSFDNVRRKDGVPRPPRPKGEGFKANGLWLLRQIFWSNSQPVLSGRYMGAALSGLFQGIEARLVADPSIEKVTIGTIAIQNGALADFLNTKMGFSGSYLGGDPFGAIIGGHYLTLHLSTKIRP